MSTKYDEIMELVNKLTDEQRDEFLRRLKIQQIEMKKEKHEQLQDQRNTDSESAENTNFK